MSEEHKLVDYARTPDQQASVDIAAIKKQAKADIAAVKQNLKEQKLRDKGKPVTKEEKLARRMQNREAKRAEYLNRKKRYTVGEEIFNSITHGVGVGLSIAATVLMIVKAVTSSVPEIKPYYVTSSAVFGTTMILVYLMSTLYHALTPIGAKKVFAILDHTSIYLMIAGTYTPFCLVALHNSFGWVLFGLIWALAVLGVTFYAIFGSRMRLISSFTYLLMGWIVICAIKPISQAITTTSLVMLIVGGGVYTIGAIFYSLKTVKWMHSIWHLFVIAGSILHFFSVFFLIG